MADRRGDKTEADRKVTDIVEAWQEKKVTGD